MNGNNETVLEIFVKSVCSGKAFFDAFEPCEVRIVNVFDVLDADKGLRRKIQQCQGNNTLLIQKLCVCVFRKCNLRIDFEVLFSKLRL